MLACALQEEPELGAVVKQLIAAQDRIKLESILAYKLESIGLVKLGGDRVNFSCELYRLYFAQVNFGAE
ncbi:MAG: AAA-like domain-containing protein [Nostoc sp.]|uniref:AAA-like domain-containing protein n=1 Tax=Nostoc sp. TaxID=1180 RepID=UPI002FF445B2